MKKIFSFLHISLLGCFSIFIHSAEIGEAKNLRFIKFDANGKALPDNATNHVCIKDISTGLIWEVKTADGGLRDKDWTYSWYNSTATDGNFGTSNGGTCHTAGHCDTEKFIHDVNIGGLCGFRDWRLPNADELLSIVDNEKNPPLININYFPNTTARSFWSSSVDANFTSYGLITCFNSGYVFYGYRSDSYSVRLVRTEK